MAVVPPNAVAEHRHSEHLVRRAQPERPQRTTPVPTRSSNWLLWLILAILALLLLVGLWHYHVPPATTPPTPAAHQRGPLPGQLAANVPPGCDTILVNGEVMRVVNLPAGECLINQEIFAPSGCPTKRVLVESRGKSKLAPGGKRWHFKCSPV